MTLTSIKRNTAVNMATLKPVLRPYSSPEIPLEQSYLRTSGLRSPSRQGSLVVTTRSETMSSSASLLLLPGVSSDTLSDISKFGCDCDALGSVVFVLLTY